MAGGAEGVAQKAPLLAVENLQVRFPIGRHGLLQKPAGYVRAVDGVTFDLRAGEALALVGESGCGKSTLALTLMGLERPAAGTIHFGGTRVDGQRGTALKAIRRQMQMVFQDPYESLNPLMRIGEIVAEPLQVHGLAPGREERAARVRQALEDAGLKPADHYAGRYPHELSGGQRQRVAVAAALVLAPQVLLADEPVSMLDVSIRAEILNLLADLKAARGIALLFITHDLGTVAAVADRIAIMYLGRIVETGPVRAVMEQPQHPYTRALLSVVPAPNPRLRRERIILQGETPDPTRGWTSCRFAPRCPVAQAVCQQAEPALRPAGGEHQAACVLVEARDR